MYHQPLLRISESNGHIEPNIPQTEFLILPARLPYPNIFAEDHSIL